MKVIYTEAHDPLADSVNAARRRVTAAMNSPVTCVTASTPLGDALQTMVRAGLRHLAVLDENEELIGILSDRAIASAWATNPAGLAHTAVSTVLEPRPVTVASAAHVLDAARLMRAAGTDAVAVIDATGGIVGIITGSDLIAQLAR